MKQYTAKAINYEENRMEKKLKFTRENTTAVKGIAIMFLIAYHGFSSESRLYGFPVSFWPLSEYTAMRICRVMVQCVGIFAFLSVYGLTLSMKSQYKEYEFSGHQATLFVLKRYIKLVLSFMLPFLFCMGVTYLTHTSRYSGGRAVKIINVIMDFLGLGHLFGTQMQINTWWYLSLEALLIFFMPLFVRFYKKYGWLTVFMSLLAGSFMLEKHVHLTKYLFVAPLAVCFADQNVLERMKAYKIVQGSALNKLLKFILSTGILGVLCKLFNTSFGMEHFEFVLNGMIPAVFVYWAYEFVIEIPGICQVLTFIGKHSANIFYIHTFIRSVWLKNISYSLGHAGAIWLFILGVSLAISILLEIAGKIIRFDKISAWISNGIMGWADRAL